MAIGALFGGIINVATHWDRIDGFWTAAKYFGVGALAGGLAAGIGAGVGGLVTDGFFSFGVASSLSVGGILPGMAIGAASGLTNGFISGAGNALIEGAGINSAISAGWDSGWKQAIFGAVTGGIRGGIIAAKYGQNLWTGKIPEVSIHTTRMNVSFPKSEFNYSERFTPNSLPDNRSLTFDGNTLSLQQNYMDGTSSTIDSWSAISGPHGNGELPHGEWRAFSITRLNPQEQLNFNSYSRDGFDFWMNLYPQFETGRMGIGIHPDGVLDGNWMSNNGTLGCIGIQEDYAELENFYNLMRAYLSRNGYISLFY